MTPHRTWGHLRAAANGPASRVGLYTAYALSTGEYVGTLRNRQRAAAVAYLRERGYQRNPLAAAKFHPAPHRAVDHGSYRRVPDAHPDVLRYRDDPPRIVTEYAPEECHYHVHLWPTPDGVEIYSHYETRGDVVRGNWSLRRMREHYRPTAGETYHRGITDLSISTI